MTTNTGGPAFPFAFTDEARVSDGMTLRDYFAAKAMAALIAGPDLKEDHYEEETNEFVAARAYMIADAMLEARQA